MTQTTVSSGQSFSSLTVGAGDSLIVAYGGTASGDVVQAGGSESVSGMAFGETVSGEASSGQGSSLGLVVAQLAVSSGGVASGTLVAGGAHYSIAVGATDYATLVTGSAAVTIRSETYITPSQAQVGGVAHGMVVVSSGHVDVGGMISGGAVSSGGSISAAGQVLGVSVGTGGRLDIGAAGYLSGAVVSGGLASIFGYQNVIGFDYGGRADGTLVVAGGTFEVANYATDSGATIGSGGYESVGGGGTTIAPTIAGGVLELGSNPIGYRAQAYTPKTVAITSGPITFSGHGGAIIDRGGPDDIGPASPSSIISGFDTTDRIYLAGIAADPSATMTVSGDIVTVSAGGRAYTMDIVGASSLGLTLGIGTQSGTIDIGIACFCTGTAILTPDGERPVEAITPGDLVMTMAGTAAPVVWVGRRGYAGRFLAARPNLRPVCIRAGSLGGGLPRRNLRVSPNHALLLDGVLIPAEALVGCPGIAVDRSCAQVDYVHLELGKHATVLAEGAPAETFLDDDSRGLFHLEAGRRGGAMTWCAPRVCDGPVLHEVQRRLLRRAAA